MSPVRPAGGGQRQWFRPWAASALLTIFAPSGWPPEVVALRTTCDSPRPCIDGWLRQVSWWVRCQTWVLLWCQMGLSNLEAMA